MSVNKEFYQSKKKLWLALILVAVFALISLLALFSPETNKLLFGLMVIFFGSLTYLFTRQLKNSTKPFLVINPSELVVTYGKQAFRIPKPDVKRAKIIKQNVSYGATAKHITIELTAAGYQEYLSQQTDTTQIIADMSTRSFPDFDNIITIPNTVEHSDEVVSTVNQWLGTSETKN